MSPSQVWWPFEKFALTQQAARLRVIRAEDMQHPHTDAAVLWNAESGCSDERLSASLYHLLQTADMDVSRPGLTLWVADCPRHMFELPSLLRSRLQCQPRVFPCLCMHLHCPHMLQSCAWCYAEHHREDDQETSWRQSWGWTSANAANSSGSR